MNLHLRRTSNDDVQTLSLLEVYDHNGNILDTFSCLELAWKNNHRQTSCIPCGMYVVKRRWSVKYGLHLEITNVSGRDNILIHSGNFHKDTLGCVLVGSDFLDINGDKYLDIVNSKRSLKELVNYIVNPSILKITNQWEQMKVIE